MRPDPKAASRLLEDGKDGTCLMFLRTDLRIRLIHALTHSASRERDKKRKSILLVLIPYLWEKFLLHCPFWERLWQQQIHRALVEVSNESTLPDRMVNNREELPCASIRHASAFPYSYESCFRANGLDPGKRKLEGGTITKWGRSRLPGAL